MKMPWSRNDPKSLRNKPNLWDVPPVENYNAAMLDRLHRWREYYARTHILLEDQILTLEQMKYIASLPLESIDLRREGLDPLRVDLFEETVAAFAEETKAKKTVGRRADPDGDPSRVVADAYEVFDSEDHQGVVPEEDPA